MIDVGPIKNFINRVRAASEARSKDIRLDILEASALSANIAQLMSQIITMETEVENLSKPQPAVLVANMDGGRFR